MSLKFQLLISLVLITICLMLILSLIFRKKMQKNNKKTSAEEQFKPWTPATPADKFQRLRREDFLNDIKNLLEINCKSTEEQVAFRLLSSSNIIEVLIFLKLQNESSHDIRVDKIVWDLWVGGHHIKEGTQIEKFMLEPKSAKNDLRLHEILFESQSADLSIASQSKISSYLEGKIYGETKYGHFNKNFTLLNLNLSFSADTRTKLQNIMNAPIIDSLTGLLPRKFLDENLQTIINKNVHHQPICFVMIDIDDFKKINDTFGHLAGDDVLRGVCEEIRSVIGEKGFCVRYGGDEFAIILQNCHIGTAQNLAEEIRSRAEKQEFKVSDETIHTTISAGISMLTEQVNFKILLKHADDMLRFSKQTGKNKVSIDLRKITSDWNL